MGKCYGLVCSELRWRKPGDGASARGRPGDLGQAGVVGSGQPGQRDSGAVCSQGCGRAACLGELPQWLGQGGAGAAGIEARREQSWAVKALVDSAQDLVLHPECWEVPAGLDTKRARQVGAGLTAGAQGVPAREVVACSEVPPETEKRGQIEGGGEGI